MSKIKYAVHKDHVFLVVLFIAKAIMVFFAVYFYSRFSDLGDSLDYIGGKYIYRDDVTSPAYLMSVSGACLMALVKSEIVVHLVSAGLSTYGIYYAFSRLQSNPRLKFLCLILVLTPSFLMWSSIYSKEAAVVFFSGIFIGGLIEIDLGKRKFLSVFQSLCLTALVLFKIYYLPVLFVLLCLTLINRHASSLRRSFLALVILAAGIVGFCLAVFLADMIVAEMPKHFSSAGAATRNNDFWHEWYQLFTFMPVGIFTAFTGPTFFEVIERPLYMPFYLESLVIVGCLLALSFHLLSSKTISLYAMLLFLTVLLGFLLIHYPFGIFNPGSAIRYRTNLILFLSVYLCHVVSIKKGLRVAVQK